MKKHYETHVEDTDKLISVAGPVLDYKSWYEQYRKLMEEQAQRKYGLYTPTSEGDEDDFPSISGMIARYSASGLTNEQMKENSVWVDKTGNDHDLQMKNFAWGGMSGVGGYKQDYKGNRWTYASSRADIFYTGNFINVTSVKINSVQLYYQAYGGQPSFTVPSYSVKVSGLVEGQNLDYRSSNGLILNIKEDGIYRLPEFEFSANGGFYGFQLNKIQESCNITIEQLPLYPGALVFDGVDDWAGCDNLPLLPKEKGYSIIALRNWITRYDATQYKRPLISNLDTNDEGAFLIEYRKDENVNDVTGSYNSFTDVYIDDNNPITWQTSSSYNGQIIKKGTSKSSNKLCICKTYFGQLSKYANAAIWEIVILDHDATEEELTKIKDYFVKTYPWLFPDQAWTVTGKTNEDEDRATIANITGNGNDLVLSNFGFAEGSGYGLYAYNFNSFNLKDNVVKPTDVKKDSFRIIGTGDNSNVLVLSNTSNSADWKIRITGMKEGDRCLIGNANKSGEYISVNKDGTYTFQKQYAATSTNGIWYNSSQEVDVLVEQIPEYEGYLVTDGVDDKAVSKQFKFGENFTVILDFKFPVKKISYCGFDLSSKVRIRNLQGSGVYVVLKGNKTLIPSNVVRAVTSEGKVYDENWNEYNIVPGNISSNYTMVNLGFDGSNQFAESATKLAGIYSSILSKDDCIKAYNYLQTLKAK